MKSRDHLFPSSPPQSQTSFEMGVTLPVSSTADIATDGAPTFRVTGGAPASVSDYCARENVDVEVGIMTRLFFGVWVRAGPLGSFAGTNEEEQRDPDWRLTACLPCSLCGTLCVSPWLARLLLH